MEKIPTIFKRGPKGGVIPELAVDARELKAAWPLEKIDGQNVRLTVRAGNLVRLEARRNPTKGQKANGIVEPWYRDVWDIAKEPVTPHLEPHDFLAYAGPADQYLLEAAMNTAFEESMVDGEYPAEAVGPKIQGNPYGIDGLHECVVFSEPFTQDALMLPHVPVFQPVGGELDFGGLQEWLENTTSRLYPGKPIEGVVFWERGAGLRAEGVVRPIGKIKVKDFK